MRRLSACIAITVAIGAAPTRSAAQERTPRGEATTMGQSPPASDPRAGAPDPQDGERNEFAAHVVKIVIDKGVLALVLLVVGFLASKRLEEHKGAIAWENELGKQRVHAMQSVAEASWLFWQETMALKKRPDEPADAESKAPRARWEAALFQFYRSTAGHAIFLPEDAARRLGEIASNANALRFALMYGQTHDKELQAFGGAIDLLKDELLRSLPTHPRDKARRQRWKLYVSSWRECYRNFRSRWRILR